MQTDKTHREQLEVALSCPNSQQKHQQQIESAKNLKVC